VTSFTLRYRTIPSDTERSAVDAAVRRHGAGIAWKDHAALSRSYALVEEANVDCAAEVAAQASAEIIESPIIALAVSPAAPKALPMLARAFGGPGAQAGVILGETVGGAAIVEWNMERTPVAVVLSLIDLELSRVRCGRGTQLRAPMPQLWWTRIASDGLHAPEIAPDRVLEHLLDQTRCR